jgi:peptidoglycan hydrolase CwlO-like protein
MGVDMNRLKCQKNGLEQYNKYLEASNNENEEKRRNMQEQLYKFEKEVSELKAQIFNEKL